MSHRILPTVLSVGSILTLALLGPVAGAPARAQPTAERLDRAESLIDAGEAEKAIDLLEPLPGDEPLRARALLLRSTARFMLGRMEEGRTDLDRSLELDPSQRQAWLNRAGLDIAEQRYDAALDALREARRLDPEAPDNHLNIGAVLLLQGRVEEAAESFERYLSVAEDRAEGLFLVAKNYAGRGYTEPAVEHLRRATEIEERYRVVARTDPAFDPISSSEAFQEVLKRDVYSPPADHHRAVRAFDVAYQGGDGPLLSAVLEALRTLEEPFDPRVEVSETWAVIHGQRLRVKLTDRPEVEDASAVRLSAPPESFDAQEWSERTERLFREIRLALLRRQRSQPEEGTEKEAGRQRS